MHTIETDLRPFHRVAVLRSIAAVDAVRIADLDRPTPCAQWTLADLLAHMTAQHRGFAAAARGRGDDESVWDVATVADAVRADPVQAYAAAVHDVLALRGRRHRRGHLRAARVRTERHVPRRTGDRLPFRGLRRARLGRRGQSRGTLRPTGRRGRRRTPTGTGDPRRRFPRQLALAVRAGRQCLAGNGFREDPGPSGPSPGLASAVGDRHR
ncbi:maleylpyruvate isomerase N-terminal domain-containing protein [Mycolicibacterium farcinogenes]|nr:maleylpyruvate isomerase N-terminal domain-containing protein [Mycolicibacterium farcinogenes]